MSNDSREPTDLEKADIFDRYVDTLPPSWQQGRERITFAGAVTYGGWIVSAVAAVATVAKMLVK